MFSAVISVPFSTSACTIPLSKPFSYVAVILTPFSAVFVTLADTTSAASTCVCLTSLPSAVAVVTRYFLILSPDTIFVVSTTVESPVASALI